MLINNIRKKKTFLKTFIFIFNLSYYYNFDKLKKFNYKKLISF